MAASSSTKVHGAWWGGFATEEIGWGLVGDAGADSAQRRRGKRFVFWVKKLVMFRDAGAGGICNRGGVIDNPCRGCLF
jgi:hypothetical protein